MKILIFGVMLALLANGIAQTDTILSYFDVDWKKTLPLDYEYYRKSYDDNGTWTVKDYYKSDQVQMVGTYKSKREKKRQGSFRYFYESGIKSSEGDFIKDKKTGLWKYYFDDGDLKSYGNYLKGHKVGEWTYNFYDAGISSKGSYIKGKKEGEWVYYHENGEVASREQFKKDKLISFEFWEEDGSKKKGDYKYEIQPEFPGGMKAMYEYLGSEIRYPQQAQDHNIMGKVFVQFIIEENGEITNVEVIKSVHSTLDKEAVRVISKMPNWNPGRSHNRKVRVRYTIPINFTIN